MSSSTGHGIILLQPDIAWFGCFECGMELKARTRARRWNPSQRCWIVSARELSMAWAILKKHHPDAQIVNEDGIVQPEPPPPAGYRSGSGPRTGTGGSRTQGDWWQEEFNRRIRDRQRQEQARKKPESSSGEGWAVQMFAAIPERLHTDVFRALLHVLHPDKNGDEVCTRALLSAREGKRGAA